MKIFISHRRVDSKIAVAISEYLREKHEVETWVDELDPYLSENGDDLSDYIQTMLSKCDHLMVVVSENTRGSWWVPFEIGMATAKDYAIVTYVIEACDLPDYLRKWPYLTSAQDLDVYITEAKRLSTKYLVERMERFTKTASEFKGEYAKIFHRNLKAALGQY